MHKLMPSNFIDSLLKREYKDDTRLKAKIVHDRLRDAQNLYNKDLVSHYGCVNAVEFLNGGQFLVSGGDDQRVLLWNVQEALQGISKPREMRAQHVSNIFCLAHDSKNTRLLSSGNDEQVIIHDIQTAEPVDVFRHHNPVYCLSVDPTNDFVFASACDDGTISIYDIRRPASSGPFLLDKSSFAYHGVHHNPIEPKLLATANTKDGAALWDSRFPNKPLMRYGSGGCMAVRWSCLGRSIVALRRRLPPALYGLYSPLPAAQFNNHNYFNSCTMKSCCFAGLNDQYVLSGSDDFNLYMWDVPAIENRCVAVEPAHLVLFGHRSIVNQVRFCPETNLIASSGVEKIIKIWSPFPLPDCKGGLTRESAIRKRRKVFSHAEYLSLVYRGGQIIDHDYSHESTDEDPRMMAFFDSLVQREIDCWSSEDSDKSHKSEAVKTTAVASNRTLSTEDDRDGRVVLQEEEEVNDDEEEVVEEQEEVVEEQEEVVEAQEEVVEEQEEMVEEQEEVVEEQEEVVEEQQEEEEEDGDETEEGGVRRKRRVQDLEKDSGEDVHSPNPIVKLIARKRSQLIRLAKRKKEDALTSSCSSSKRTSSAGTSNDSSSADSVDADGGNSNKMSGKILKKQRLMRLRKRMLEAFNDSSDENESAETPSSAHTPGKLRRRTCDDAAASSSAHKSPPAAQATPATTREGETPDSGIYMLSDEHTNGTFPKNRSNCNRNYRRRILDSDSD